MPMRRNYVVLMRWMVIYEYEVPGGALNPSFAKLPRPWSPWESSPSRKNSHGRTGNWTRDLMVTCIYRYNVKGQMFIELEEETLRSASESLATSQLHIAGGSYYIRWDKMRKLRCLLQSWLTSRRQSTKPQTMWVWLLWSAASVV
jgi:hypothetical protein